MEIFNHNLEMLFQQLGLPSDKKAILTFIKKHTLNDTENLASARFWTNSQRQFLEEGKLQDADWIEQIDSLDNLLRKK